jgi:AcrR family transcriptional regulator
VADDQRRRIHEAMVEVAVTRGYRAATIKAVCTLAGVSRQTFYELFGGGSRHPKEACFLGAYDYVVARAAQRVRLAYSSERDPERRLCRALERFAREAAGEPLAARFALVEAFGAGPAALQRCDRTRRTFEQMIAASVGGCADGEERLSPAIVKGIVGGIERVARVQLLAGRIGELPDAAEELSGWVSSYRLRSLAPAPSARLTEAGEEYARDPCCRLGLRCRDERLRVLRATAAIAARDGYTSLSVARIVRLAEVNGGTFARLYGGSNPVEACFLAAFELLAVEMLVCASRASRAAGCWSEGVRDAIVALIDHLASHPYAGRVAFLEIFAVGPAATERRSGVLHRFAQALVGGIPHAQRPSELIAEAIVGAIWAVIHDYVVRGRAHQLRDLADQATYLALTPMIGHEAATRLIVGDLGSVRVPIGVGAGE